MLGCGLKEFQRLKEFIYAMIGCLRQCEPLPQKTISDRHTLECGLAWVLGYGILYPHGSYKGC